MPPRRASCPPGCATPCAASRRAERAIEPGAFDLEAYLARIGHGGGRSATIATLRELHARHAEAIAFENLDPLLRRPVRLDPRSLVEKLVHGGRGGWCFEQNALFALALRTLGFTVTGLGARVVWNQAAGAIPARTHMVLKVSLDEDWIADVGFGGQTLTGPVRLAAGVEQQTPHEPFRLVDSGGAFTMQSKIEGEWRALYRFDLTEHHAADYELANWYLCTHPSSHFLQGLVAARSAPGVRYALRGNELSVHRAGASSVRRKLTSAAELRGTLEGEFRLRLPEGPDLAAALERAAAG